MGWGVSEAWDAAVGVVAEAYQVDREELTAESRGRGPRPPRALWGPKKEAVYLTVILSGCDYSALARAIGLHKDTIASHCAGIREACVTDGVIEARIEGLRMAAAIRLDRGGTGPTVRATREAAAARWDQDSINVASLLMGLGARLDRVEGLLRDLLGHPTASDYRDSHPTPDADHANVITLRPTA